MKSFRADMSRKAATQGLTTQDVSGSFRHLTCDLVTLRNALIPLSHHLQWHQASAFLQLL